MTIIPSNVVCPRCFSKDLYRFGKDNEGFQKYQCQHCKRQFAPDNPTSNFQSRKRKYPDCPICGKVTFLHHDYTYYSTAAHSLLSSCKRKFGQPQSAVISDRYYAYQQPASLFFPEAKHIRVEDFDDLINNNVIEAFNGQFKAWYKPKRGFNSFESANRLIATYIFFYNFVRPHLSLNGLTPAQVGGAKYSEKERLFWLLVA